MSVGGPLCDDLFDGLPELGVVPRARLVVEAAPVAAERLADQGQGVACAHHAGHLPSAGGGTSRSVEAFFRDLHLHGQAADHALQLGDALFEFLLVASAEGQVGVGLKLFSPALDLLGHDAMLLADLALGVGPGQQGERHAGLELGGEPASLGHDCCLLCQDGTRE